MTNTTTTKKRIRRTPDQIIADLQAEIARVKARAERAKAKKDPCHRHVVAAVRSLDKADAETKDSATRKAIVEARATLTAYFELQEAASPNGRGARPRASRGETLVDPQRVLDFLVQHPGSRSKEIAANLGTDTASLRKALHQLRDEGKVKVKGKARAMRYTATG